MHNIIIQAVMYASVKNQYIISDVYKGASRRSPTSEIGRHNIITTGDFQSLIVNNNNNNALSVPHEPIIRTHVGRWKMDKPLTGCYGNIKGVRGRGEGIRAICLTR